MSHTLVSRDRNSILDSHEEWRKKSIERRTNTKTPASLIERQLYCYIFPFSNASRMRNAQQTSNVRLFSLHGFYFGNIKSRCRIMKWNKWLKPLKAMRKTCAERELTCNLCARQCISSFIDRMYTVQRSKRFLKNMNSFHNASAGELCVRCVLGARMSVCWWLLWLHLIPCDVHRIFHCWIAVNCKPVLVSVCSDHGFLKVAHRSLPSFILH